MLELLKENWFVVVIAIVIIAFIGYFVYDNNKYNVSSASDGNSDVVASIKGGSVTSDELYAELSKNDEELLYNLYKNAVVDQTVKSTKSIKKDAKTLEDNITSAAKQQDPDNYETVLEQELASYGYTSIDDLNKYCTVSVKERSMNEAYVQKHFDSLVKALDDKKPRTISIISMSVSDPENLTDAETKKKNNIDSSLSTQSFAKTATAYSEDTTASEKGLYGYVDSDDAKSSNSSLNADVINAALDLKKGETSDWVTVTDNSSDTSYLYKVHVNETDVNKINQSKNETIRNQLLYAILNSNNGLEETIVQSNAKKLKIKFNDKSVEKKINSYIEQQKKGDSSNENDEEE